MFVLLFNYVGQAKIKNDNFPFKKVDTSKWKDDPLKITAKSEVELLKKLLNYAGSEGGYQGTIKQDKDWNGNLITIIRDEYVPDDSAGISEAKFVSKRDENFVYHVVEYSRRISCKRGGPLVALFINPYWTDRSCL